MQWVHKRHGLSLLLSALTLVGAGGCAAKQPARSFPELQQRVKPGHTVYVIDDAGSETKGEVVAVSASELTLEVDNVRQSMGAAKVRQVQRYGDSVWNGTVIGLSLGALSLMMTDSKYVPCKNEPQKRCEDYQAGQRIVLMGVWGAIGAGIDALIRGRHQVYLAPGQPLRSAGRVVVSPQLGTSGAGVVVMVDLNSRNHRR